MFIWKAWKRVVSITLTIILALCMFLLTGCGDYERPVSEQKAPASGNQKSTETVSVQKTEGHGNDISPSPEVKGSLRIQLEPTKVPSPTPEPTNPIEIAADARVDVKLRGLHDADEFVTVNVSLGMCDVDKLFKEQYPEVYDAYLMYKEATDYEYGKPWPTAAHEKYGDRLDELVLQGSELNNTLGRIWYEEQEAAFFSRHPELERCKTGGFLSIDMKLCYRDLTAIISDSAVEKIAFNDTEWHKPHVVGVYQGKEVYDLTAKVTRAIRDVEPVLGVINSDVYGLSEIDDNAFLRVSFVLHKGYEDSEAEGKVKLDAAFEALMEYEWPIVEFVEVSRPDSWCERYLTVLATKQQLETLVVPDTSIYYDVYWEGYIRGALSDLEDGSVLPKEPEPTPSDMIRQYQEALGDSIPRVIGAYNGKNVYDVEIAHEFDYAFDDAAHQGGDFFLKFDQAVFREMDDGDYLRIAFVLDADYELVNPLLQSEYDAITGNKPGYEEWLTSEDGMQALKKIELSLTETAAAAIRDNEWIYLGEGYDEAISQCRGCRYVMVLTTKAQLVEFIPELNQLLAGNQMPDKQSIDTNSLVYVYPAGIVEMMINDIPVGEQIR